MWVNAWNGCMRWGENNLWLLYYIELGDISEPHKKKMNRWQHFQKSPTNPELYLINIHAIICEFGAQDWKRFT